MISQSVSTSDYHTAGEPFRVVADPPVGLPGDSVADRRARALHTADAQELRELLCFEPRGHADMYGGFIVPAGDDGADRWEYEELITLGREVKWALNDSEHAAHPTDLRLSGVYGTILYEELGDAAGQVRQRNVTVFAEGQVDRSPCGSATRARLAIPADQARVGVGGPTLHHESIVQSLFAGAVVGTTTVAGRPAVVPQITGLAHRTGEHTFVVDPADPLVPGFVLR